MPVQVEVDPRQRLAKRTYSGIVSGRDLLDSIQLYSTIPDFDPSFDELMDFRGIQKIDAETEVIHQCALRAAPFTHESRRVILAPQELVFGLARMYQALGADMHPNLHVVRTAAEANRILQREVLEAR